MYCPSCGFLNLPGADQCAKCLFDTAALDRPAAQDRVEASLMTDPIAVLTPRRPVTVAEDSTLGAAMRAMIDRGVGALLVTGEGGKLTGILTERDFLTKVAGETSFEGHAVRDYMTANPETVSADDPIAFGLRMMDVGGYRHLPVVAGDMPVGVVSVRDILQHVTKLCKEP